MKDIEQVEHNVTVAPEVRAGLRGYYAAAMQDLIEAANEDGVVLTIELEPVAPLAMGNYVMRGHVRGAR